MKIFKEVNNSVSLFIIFDLAKLDALNTEILRTFIAFYNKVGD